MTQILKIRLTLFAFAIVVLAGLIGWAAYTSRSEITKLQTRFSTGHLRSFEIADHLQSSILKLNSMLTRHEMENSATSLKEFKVASAELSTWLEQQRPALSSPAERELLNKVVKAYEDYLRVAVMVSVKKSPDHIDHLARLQSASQASLVILELGYQLADAHRQMLEDFLQASQKSVLTLQRLIFGFLVLLLASLFWLFITVYQEMIGPLQRKLVQSHAIIERQEKLASLGVLAAGVAHEIRNPLTAIKARLFTQRKSLEKNSPEFEDSTVISNEINRLEKIVKDFLEFARPSEPRFITMKAETALRDVAEFMMPQLRKSEIQMKLEDCTDVPFHADPQQLKQVLINLIQNSAESINTEGVILLRGRSGLVRLKAEQKRVVILEVEDNGSGIAPEVRKRLFDPFFSTKEAGTGLGLAISARILEKHGGALEFQTQVGRGTTFGIVLPALET